MIRQILQFRYMVVSFLGAVFALLVWKIMTMNFRYAVAVSGAVVLLSLSMMAIYGIVDFLVLAQVLNIPLVEFSKWLIPQYDEVAPARGVAMGLAELLLLISYAVWFARVFVAKVDPLPKLRSIDAFAMLFIFAGFVSSFGAYNRLLAFIDVIYNIKYFLIFYFLSHKLEKRHLKWVIVFFAVTICVESLFALYERMTGNVGFASTKGDTKSVAFGDQYVVPGIEHQIRAMGTTNDSHSLGLYYSMLLPVPFVFLMLDYLKPRTKLLLLGVFMAGLGGLILTFSRSGWLSFAIAGSFALAFALIYWKQGRAVLAVGAIVFLASVLYPKGYADIYERIAQAPAGIMESRMDMNWAALSIWTDNFFFGCGPGNFVYALKASPVPFISTYDLPVHNAFLWIASEMGLFGVISFFGTIIIAMLHCRRALRCEDPLLRGLALAALTALFAYLLDGLTDPMFRYQVPYAQLWFYMALSVSFERFTKLS